MTKEETEKRYQAEKRLKDWWDARPNPKEPSRRDAYIALSEEHYRIGKILYETDKNIKKLAKEAGLEVTDVLQNGDIIVVSERHTRAI